MGAGTPRSGLSEQGWGRRSPLTYSSPQEYEHLAASLDGARTPLLEKMHAFSPASSKLELVEAAEAHAWQLDQLALNLSRYGTQTGWVGQSWFARALRWSSRCSCRAGQKLGPKLADRSRKGTLGGGGL